ncbi:hypothetical protein AB0K15_13160 [Amycolatopsis sp. NPDC049253]|uniref:hypothetical protein n=1 Tax=Amycolatopsis sp. NPDC049253 TaxID=3155274 RepID=UPI00342D05D3
MGSRLVALGMCLGPSALAVKLVAMAPHFGASPGTTTLSAVVTIKRWGARITAADEVAATLPIGLGTYGRKHGIAFELADGTLSPTSAATAWVGSNSRRILLDALDTHATAHGVTVRIINPNNGGLFGIGWDIRIGDGIPRPKKART